MSTKDLSKNAKNKAGWSSYKKQKTKKSKMSDEILVLPENFDEESRLRRVLFEGYQEGDKEIFMALCYRDKQAIKKANKEKRQVKKMVKKDTKQKKQKIKNDIKLEEIDVKSEESLPIESSQLTWVDGIKLDKAQQEAINKIQDGKNIFLTGKAGTGKSLIVKRLLNLDIDSFIPLAPTGIAAINLDGKGSTLHSFFGIPLDATLRNINEKLIYKEAGPSHKNLNILKGCKGLLIDEVSMVRSDLFDIVDEICRYCLGINKPFGGKQIVCVGDLYQLPPVLIGKEREFFYNMYKSEFFFSSYVFGECKFEVIELDKIYRQNDSKFIEVLNNFRTGIYDKSDIDHINSRVIEDRESIENSNTITLTPTNKKAEEINEKCLNKLPGKLYTSIAEVHGEFPDSKYPAEKVLSFKIGSQIMCIRNQKNNILRNGTIGTISKIETDDDEVVGVWIKLENQNEYMLRRETRQVFTPYRDKKQNSIEYQETGAFIQFPFKLGWASTIHKSQGLSLDKVHIDLDRGAFEKGQTYVALSRATSFDGLTLNKPIKESDIKTNVYVINFMGKSLLEAKLNIIKEAIFLKKDIFFSYRKGSGEISKRRVTPKKLKLKNFEGYDYRDIEGFCHIRKAKRHFNVAKMFELEIRE